MATILQGTVKGARRIGRQKKRWEDNIKEWSYEMETLVAIATKVHIYATAIKNNIYVEANAMNISAKFQLHPPYSF